MRRVCWVVAYVTITEHSQYTRGLYHGEINGERWGKMGSRDGSRVSYASPAPRHKFIAFPVRKRGGRCEQKLPISAISRKSKTNNNNRLKINWRLGGLLGLRSSKPSVEVTILVMERTRQAGDAQPLLGWASVADSEPTLKRQAQPQSFSICFIAG